MVISIVGLITVVLITLLIGCITGYAIRAAEKAKKQPIMCIGRDPDGSLYIIKSVKQKKYPAEADLIAGPADMKKFSFISLN